MIWASIETHKNKITSDINAYTGISENAKQSAITAETAASRLAIKKMTSDERYKALGDMKHEVDALAAVRPMYRNAMVVLARAGLGSAERDAYTNQLRDSSVVELEGFAQVAVVTKDPVLGAVVAQRLGALNNADRKSSTSINSNANTS